MTSAICRPSPRCARCGPTASPAAPWPAPAPSRCRWPTRPTWWWTDRPGWWSCSRSWPARSRTNRTNGAACLAPLPPERGELVAQPPGGRVSGGGGGERGAAALALGVRHGQRLVQRLGRLGDVERVDEQGIGGQRGGGARLAREHQRAAALGEHRALLGDQVHAVPDRVDQQHVGERAGG